MALVNCPECQKEVSQEALKCPNCGKVLRKAKRTLMGKVFKWLFILFNIFMVFWLFNALGATSKVVTNAASEAEKAGAAIGAGIGTMFLFTFWAIGDIILGIMVLFTKPKQQ